MANLELTGDEATGRNIVLRALEEPVRQIAHNAGFEGSIVIDRLKMRKLVQASTQQLASGST